MAGDDDGVDDDEEEDDDIDSVGSVHELFEHFHDTGDEFPALRPAMAQILEPWHTGRRFSNANAEMVEHFLSDLEDAWRRAGRAMAARPSCR